jgi:hypothetical protein
MKYLKRFNESINEYFSLTDKYNELSDDLLYPLVIGHDEWLRDTPTHIKLLSMLCGVLDANLVNRFQLDDTFFDALENEYEYTDFKLTKDEVIESCYRLKEEGFLE